MQYAIGVDIGGTNTRVALIDEDLKIVRRDQFSTNVEDPYITLNQVNKIIKSFGEKNIVGIGLSCPGPLDLIKGSILETPNLHGAWHYFNVAAGLSHISEYPVSLQNDANLAALAEATVGEGKGQKIVQFLTVSTGLGSGLVIDGEIYIGAHGYAHEIASICMWRNGPSHGSVYPGGIEAISSGTGITLRAQKGGLNVEHAGEVNDLAMQGNSVAMEVMEDAKEYLANAIATIFAIVDPSIIILGGSVALKIEGFVEEVEKRVKSKVYPNLASFVDVRKSTLNEDSGLIGAACLAFNEVNK